MHAVALWARKSASAGVIGDEEDIDFDGCMESSTCSFICTHNGWTELLTHGVAAGLISFQALDVLQWDVTKVVLGGASGAVVHFCGWFAVSVTLYSLGLNSPADPAWHKFEVGAISRAVHLILAMTPLQLARHGEVVLSPATASGLYGIIAAMPLLWMLGTLPPIDAALEWLAEQMAICLFGASPTASPERLIVTLTGAGIAVLVTWGVSHVSIGAAVAVSSGIAALLSQGLQPAFRLTQNENHLDDIVRTLVPGCVGFALRSLSAAVASAIFIGVEVGGSTASAATDFGSALGWTLLIVRGLAFIWAQLNQPFFLRFVHNCFYPAISKRSHTPLLRRFHVMLALLLRLIGSVTLQILLTADGEPIGAKFAFAKAIGGGQVLVWSVLVARALRVMWQTPIDGATELGIVIALGQLQLTDWNGIEFPARLLLVGFCYGRMRDFLQKSMHIIVLLATSWTSKSQRESFNTAAHILLTLLLPLWIVTAAAAALFAAPLLPLLGAPLFVIAYPRPMWHAPPSNAICASSSGKADDMNVDPDVALYKQMTPGLMRAVVEMYEACSAAELRAGDMLLARYEDVIVWLACHESGFGYCVLSVTGLELKITSCHNVEGLRLDEVLAPASEAGSPQCHNRWWGHLLVPIGRRTVEVYSSSPVRLAGIIDNKEALSERLPAAFMKALVWHFCAEGAVLGGRTQHDVTELIDRDDISVASEYFPKHWANHAASACRHKSRDSPFVDCDLRELAVVAFVVGGGLEMVGAHNPLSVPAHGRRIAAYFAFEMDKRRGPMDMADPGLPSMLVGARVPPEFRAVVVQAYRIAFKLVYDATLQLLSERELDRDGGSNELADCLVELTDKSNWYLGPMNSDWSSEMLKRTASLFTVGKGIAASGTVDQGEGSSSSEEYTARLLQFRNVEVLVGKLNASAVRGTWAALSHELHYLGADDDERYSMQANPQLLRNITIEAAPPTVGGYPLFVSERVECGTGSKGDVRSTKSKEGIVADRKDATLHSGEPEETSRGNVVPPVRSDLPYGGDMTMAMRNQDREAIRKIMAARQSQASVSPPTEPSLRVKPKAVSSEEQRNVGQLAGKSTQNASSSSVVVEPGPAGSSSWMESFVASMPDEDTPTRGEPQQVDSGNHNDISQVVEDDMDDLDELERMIL
eukprot:SAG31_NODE_287_length_18430_cov_8.127544_10_plen_1156_part_00